MKKLSKTIIVRQFRKVIIEAGTEKIVTEKELEMLSEIAKRMTFRLVGLKPEDNPKWEDKWDEIVSQQTKI